MKETVLIVEDNRYLSNIFVKAIKSEFGLEPIVANSLSETSRVLAMPSNRFICAIVDLRLPDADEGEAVALVVSRNIPTMVLTASHNETLRDKVLSMNILNYHIKGGKVLERILSMIRRMRTYREVKVMIVDDSRTTRAMVKKLLMNENYHVLEAEDGNKAMELLQAQEGIKLIITDYHMPGMDGFDLITQIRQHYGQDEVAIIGLSSSEKKNLTARFLKVGANDFLYKGFSVDEFKCRVRQNVELVERFEEIKEASNRDTLTQLYNRRYFFESCTDLLEVCRRGESPFALAMMDLDFFKKINDTYGHDAGDVVLRQMGRFLKNNSRKSDIIARYGGEEFSFFATNIQPSAVIDFFDELRKDIEQMVIPYDGHEIRFTISIGVVTKAEESLEETLKAADKLLYMAKASGRNKVASDLEDPVTAASHS